MTDSVLLFREALNQGNIDRAQQLLADIRATKPEQTAVELELLLDLQSNQIDTVFTKLAQLESGQSGLTAEMMRVKAEALRRTARTLEALRIAEIAHQTDASVDTAFTLAECMQTGERFEEAVELLCGILKNVNSAPVRLRLASAYRRLDKNQQAIEQYEAVLKIDPKDIESWYGIAACTFALGRQNDALALIDKAQEVGVTHPHIINLKASIFERQERYSESNLIYREIVKTLRVSSTLTSAGWSEFSIGNDDQALALFREAADCYRPPNFKEYAAVRAGGVPIAFETFKIKHDFEQMHWLCGRGLLPSDYLPLMRAYEEALARANGQSAITIKERTDLWDLALKWHERLVYAYPMRVPKHVLNPKLPFRDIEEAYAKRQPPVIVVDDFLTEEAVEELRTFCFATTGFRRAYRNGYLGIFMESGFANPLILKLAREFCAAFPRIVRRSKLHQAWAFKYDSNMKGINMHADFAKINANFWITPTDSNLLPERGGMVIYDIPAPKEWTFADYNSKSDKMREFLKANNATAWRVPHKQNRCVFFDSTLFHETDEVKFVDEYEQRRINVTLLFGKGLRDDLL